MAVRKIILLTAIVAFMASIVSPVSFASDGSSDAPKPGAAKAKKAAKDPGDVCKGDPLRKLGRGISNCLTFPLEFPNQISKTNNNDGPMAALTYGVVKGLTMTMFRAVIGVYEVISFPLPLPEWYKPILTDPEFMLEEWNV